MRVLDLFSGIGGFSLGLERAGMQTVAFCEYEEFPRKVLAKHWPNVPCYPDVRELTKEVLIHDGILADTISIASPIRGHDPANAGEGAGWRAHEGGSRSNDCGQRGTGTNGTNGGARPSPGPIDLICGGYPCQPFSHAGKRAGAEDDRHLWPEMFRLIETIRPRWVLAENVAGHISMGLDDVLSDLEGAGYAWWAFVIPACAVDARHRRDRVWIIGNANEYGESALPVDDEMAELCSNADVANAKSERACRKSGEVRGADGRQIGKLLSEFSDSGWWQPEPPVGRVAHGISNRVDRLRSLGNAVVPQVVEVIGRAIMECEA